MKKNNVKQNMGVTGIVTVRRYKAGTIDKAREMIAQYGKGKSSSYLKELFAENFLGIGARNNNLVVANGVAGRNNIALHLTGVYTTALAITYGEIGTNATAPTNADTALGTPTLRKSVDDYDLADNVATFRFFFPDSELVTATYYEFGTFTNGTITLSSGQLFNHALFSPSYVKATGEDTTVEVEFTIS
ncbi:MAG: hypothetical protein M3P98_01585 [bacterium]|nr:hypothetical protein [bacterium]